MKLTPVGTRFSHIEIDHLYVNTEEKLTESIAMKVME